MSWWQPLLLFVGVLFVSVLCIHQDARFEERCNELKLRLRLASWRGDEAEVAEVKAEMKRLGVKP